MFREFQALALIIAGLAAIERLWLGRHRLIDQFGNGLTMPGSMSGAMSVRPDLAGSASGLMGALIVAGGAVLPAPAGAVLPQAGGAPGLFAPVLGSSLAGPARAVWAGRPRARPPPA